MENIKLTAVVTGILMTLILNNVQCTLNTKPKDAAAKIGDYVIMRCSSSHVNRPCGSISWKHYTPNSTVGKLINTNDQLKPSFTPYISIVNSTAGNCDLRINATPSTAGEYQCTDFDSADTNTSAVLIVLENDPDVKVNHSDSKITALECSVNYYGKWAHKVQWEKFVENRWTNVIETESNIIKNPAVSLIQFSSIIHIPKDGAKEHFKCDVTILTIYNWSSLECPAGRNITPKAKEPVPALLAKAYNDGLGHGFGIGFVLCLCLCGIIFLLLWHFIFRKKGDAIEETEEGNSQTNHPTSTDARGGSQAANPYETMDLDSPPSAAKESNPYCELQIMEKSEPKEEKT